MRPTSRQRMQRLANELAADGLVEFIDNARRRRSKLVRLTLTDLCCQQSEARRRLPCGAPYILTRMAVLRAMKLQNRHAQYLLFVRAPHRDERQAESFRPLVASVTDDAVEPIINAGERQT